MPEENTHKKTYAETAREIREITETAQQKVRELLARNQIYLVETGNLRKQMSEDKYYKQVQKLHFQINMLYSIEILLSIIEEMLSDGKHFNIEEELQNVLTLWSYNVKIMSAE